MRQHLQLQSRLSVTAFSHGLSDHKALQAAHLSKIERVVAILDHVFDLPPHCKSHEHDPIHQEDGPEHWHVQEWEHSGNEPEEERPCRQHPACRKSVSRRTDDAHLGDA